LRILRYIRFFSNYSKLKHQPEIIKIIKKNIEGISNLSPERLIDEFKKIVNSKGFIKIFHNKESLELIEIIFPEFKNIHNFTKLNPYALKNLEKIDFIFLLSLLIIDGTDNADYFFYRFKISKKDQKRLRIINLFYKDKINVKSFTEKNLNKIFYFSGKEAVIDIINYQLFSSSKIEKKLIELIRIYKDKDIPRLPVGAEILMKEFNIPEGKTLGNKLKIIEEKWVQNGFQISDKEVQKIAKS
jgi:poly(A) polymerase